MSGRIRLTKKGLEKIKAELEELSTKKRREIARALEHARAFGDLRENAEYDAAKNAQAMNEKRINDLSDQLSRAEVIDEEGIPKDQVFLGATVTLEDQETDEKIIYMIVSGEESDYRENKISMDSPIGKSLLGHKVGEIVSVKVPAGVLKYKITKIER